MNKLFLRILSLILAISVIITTFEYSCAVSANEYSATFKENPLIVKPVTEWESDSVASKSKQFVVTPLDWSTANGLELTTSTEYTNEYTANSLAYARFKTTDFVLGDAKYVIMYVKTDCANTILPAIGYEGAPINVSYDPLMTIGVGKPYSYLRIGGDKWVSSTTVATWKSSSGDKDGDGISDTYFGGIRFDSAFEGYIKFAIADLSNDSARINKLDRATTKISLFNLSVSKLGGQYGTVTAGPIFLTESDSTSNAILTPEIEAVPFENFTVGRSGGYGNSVYPIENCSLTGESFDRNLAWVVPQTQFATISSCRLQFTGMNQSMKGTEGYMFYLSVPEKTTTTFIMVLNDPNDTSRWRFSYAPSMMPLAEKEFYFLSEGDNVWQSGKMVYTNENGSKYRAGVYFEEGFSGYVKIPYSSLGNDSGFKFNAGLDSLNSLTFYFDRFGGKYGQIIAGPNFLVLNDGTSGEIALKNNYEASAFEIDNTGVSKGIEIGKISNNEIINKELKIKGSVIGNDTLLEYATNQEVGPQSKRFLNFNYNNEALSGAEGLVLYVKLPDKNLVTLNALLEFPEDTSRWSWSYAPSLSLYEGTSCYVLPLGADEWQEKTVVNASTNSYNGGIEFDAAFEGYIKIPFTALKNDSGFTFSAEKDILKAVTLRFKRVGGSYGNVAASDVYLLKNDSPSGINLVSKGVIGVAESSYGTVSVDKESAYSGDRVSVNVTAKDGYALKADGLRIIYSDYLGIKNQIVADYDKYENAFYFTMPKAENVSLSADFVSTDKQNFAVVNPVAADENSLEFTFREFKNSYHTADKGVLIALEDSLGGNALTADLNGVDIINATFSDADNTFELQENRAYSDYTVRLKDIKTANLKRNYVVRGYQVVGGLYSYTKPIVISYNDLVGMFSEYESLPEVYANGSNYKITCSDAATPCEELNYTKGIKATAATAFDVSLSNLRDSAYWFKTGISPVDITDYYYIGIYIKAPSAKDNILYMNFTGTNGQTYQILPGNEYVLINRMTGKKEYRKVIEGSNRYSGVISIPSGFEGLMCIAVPSLNPQNTIKPTTQLSGITYRFGYIGSGENAVTVGPIVGFKQKGRVIENKELIPQLPKGSDSLRLDSSATEMKDNTAILYWDNYATAENYLVKAYKKVIGGYLCVSENTLFSNSGSIDCLEKDEEYLITVCARDKRDNVLAEYTAEKLVFKPDEGYTDVKQEGIIYDSVDYTAGNTLNSPFVKRSYTTLNAYNSDLLSNNPNRGFRGCIDFFHFNLTDDAIKAEIERDIKKVKENGFNGNVYVCYFYPGDYLGKDLGSEFFVSAQKIFDYFRENKMQILLRFAYFDVNNFNKRTPTTDEILQHINQLSQNGIIEKNKDILHSFQVGFAGKFGEWHSDTPASTRADRYEVLNAFVTKLLPDNVYAQLRMPNFKDFLSSENLVKYGNRFGFHLDSFYGIMDGTELGSGQYSYGCVDWDRHIAEACAAPNDAEAYYWSQFDDVAMYPEAYASVIAASQLRMTTFSAVNGYLDQNVNASGCINEWKKQPITENWLKFNNLPVTEGWARDNGDNKINRNAYEYIRDYLGYRISAKELTVTQSNNGMNISLDLVNYGFSAAFNLSSNLVILDSNNNVVYSKKVGNPAEWYGTVIGVVPNGKLLTHSINASMGIPTAKGNYKIALQLVSNSGATARLDNNIPYENGYNILHSFKIGG